MHLVKSLEMTTPTHRSMLQYIQEKEANLYMPNLKRLTTALILTDKNHIYNRLYSA